MTAGTPPNADREVDPGTAVRLGVAVLHYRNWPQVVDTIESVLDQGVECSLVIVDNHSDDGSADRIGERFPDHRLIETAANGGYAKAMNEAISVLAPSSDVILLLTHEVLLSPGLIERLVVELRENPACGACGPLVAWRDEPELVFSAGGVLKGRRKAQEHVGWRRPVDEYRDWAGGHVEWLDGCCVMYRTEALAGVDGFDENYFLYFEELDLHCRLRDAGWSIRIVGDAVAWQQTNPLRDRSLWVRNRLRFTAHHADKLGLLNEVAVQLRGLGDRRLSRDDKRSVVRGIGGFLTRRPPSWFLGQ